MNTLHNLANLLEDIAYFLRQKAMYNRWTTCKHCYMELGYGHKKGCPELDKKNNK